MSFYRRIKYFLVHTLKITNKDAQHLIAAGKVEIDGTVIFTNELLDSSSEVKVNGISAREAETYVYLKFYKPKGLQSSLSEKVMDNLSSYFVEYKNLAIAGRLDKDSEGLILLSNDGKWVEEVCNPKYEKEKEYLVTLNKHPEEIFIDTFSSGIIIQGYKTKPCYCKVVGSREIKVILTEGKNRQIRRMCHKLGYTVEKLVRLRIGSIRLDNLQSSEIEQFVQE
jgi:23S rRNA pseudouridine2604 synthase